MHAGIPLAVRLSTGKRCYFSLSFWKRPIFTTGAFSEGIPGLQLTLTRQKVDQASGLPASFLEWHVGNEAFPPKVADVHMG